jgi:hypothetical protein
VYAECAELPPFYIDKVHGTISINYYWTMRDKKIFLDGLIP